uniref:Uncharacterized protein n=1 Tax=Ixodes ricinus TaxID=34613 RepID=A0A6B0UVE1_IXORI
MGRTALRQLVFVPFLVFLDSVKECWLVGREHVDGHSRDVEVLPLVALLLLLCLKCPMDQLHLLLAPCLGRRHKRPRLVLVDGDLLHLGLDLGHPGRICHRSAVQGNAGARQGELNRGRGHLEYQMCRLFHPQPALIAELPQGLKPE